MIRKERIMKRLILLFVLLLSCVSLCRYAYPPVPVVYGFLTDDYMDPNPATIANRQIRQHYFSDEWSEDEDGYPDWYGGIYSRYLIDAPHGKLHAVIQIVRGHSYMEDEIHEIMAQVENAGYAFEYVSVSFEDMRLYWQECSYVEEIGVLVLKARERGIPISGDGVSEIEINQFHCRLRYVIYTNHPLIEIVGFKNYLKYLWDPRFELFREPYKENQLH